MKLLFSVAARKRPFSKAMQRIDKRLAQLCDAFQTVELDYPIHEAILILITDDKEQTFFEEVKNSDGYFQVIAGCSLRNTDDELTEDVFKILLRAVRLCPFATPDHDKFEALFERFRSSLIDL